MRHRTKRYVTGSYFHGCHSFTTRLNIEFRRAFIDDDYGMSGMVDSLIVKRSKDFVAMYDFAQFHSGASIETSLTTNNPKRKKMRHSLKELSWDLPPGAALLPGLGLGNCWVLEGGAGLIGIRLSSQTCISHVTVEHIPAELSIDISTAPRQMRLWGFLRMLADTDAAITVNKTGNYPHSRPPLLAAYEARNGGLFALLGEFEYNVTSPLYIQTFTTLNLDSESTTFEVVVLEVLTNWGNDHTCLYRVRIHCPDR